MTSCFLINNNNWGLCWPDVLPVIIYALKLQAFPSNHTQNKCLSYFSSLKGQFCMVSNYFVSADLDEF